MSKGWTIASFQSEEDFNEAKGKINCDVYIGATSDGNGNWKWIDDSTWWAHANSDGLKGKKETKIVVRKSDLKWNDWSNGDILKGVICKNPGTFQNQLLLKMKNRKLFMVLYRYFFKTLLIFCRNDCRLQENSERNWLHWKYCKNRIRKRLSTMGH